MYQSRCVSGDNPWDKALPPASPLRPIELETEIEKIKAYDSLLGGNPEEDSQETVQCLYTMLREAISWSPPAR
jgi:hypothetical protein